MNEKGGWDIYYLYIMSVYPTAKSSHTRRYTGFTWKKKTSQDVCTTLKDLTKKDTKEGIQESHYTGLKKKKKLEFVQNYTHGSKGIKKSKVQLW